MEVKGTAVKSIRDYVENKYKTRYREWLQVLPKESQEIINTNIYANNWYPIKDGAIEPTKAIAKLFFNNDTKEAAFQSGRYSAEVGLKGVYKIFIIIAKPSYIMQRASRVFQSYYNPSDMSVTNSTDKSMVLNITKFPEPNSIVEYRIAGWIQRALELTNCKNVDVKISKSLTKGDDITEFNISWN